jgi:hypothetical protein
VCINKYQHLALWKNRAVHCPGHDGAQAVTMPYSRDLYQKMAVVPDNTRWCTTLTMVVYTVTSGDHLGSYCARPSPGGHHPRGGGTTRQLVVVPLGQHAALNLPTGHHHRGGGAPDRGWQCHPGSTPSPVSPPFLYQLFHLCKCANTTKCSPTCACVLAFHKHSLKG